MSEDQSPDYYPEYTIDPDAEYYYVWVEAHIKTLANGTEAMVAPHWRKQYFAGDGREYSDG